MSEKCNTGCGLWATSGPVGGIGANARNGDERLFGQGGDPHNGTIPPSALPSGGFSDHVSDAAMLASIHAMSALATSRFAPVNAVWTFPSGSISSTSFASEPIA